MEDGKNISSTKTSGLEHPTVLILPERITGRNDYPIGMAGIGYSNRQEPILSLGNSKGMVISGELNRWGCPTCEILIGAGKVFAYVTAVIDTGAYHTHINNDIAKRLGAVCKSEELHKNPVYGDVSLPIYMMSYAFKDREDVSFVSDIRGMDFEEDMLIGNQFILEFCDLHIYGKEKRFELKFY